MVGKIKVIVEKIKKLNSKEISSYCANKIIVAKCDSLPKLISKHLKWNNWIMWDYYLYYSKVCLPIKTISLRESEIETSLGQATKEVLCNNIPCTCDNTRGICNRKKINITKLQRRILVTRVRSNELQKLSLTCLFFPTPLGIMNENMKFKQKYDK